MSEPLNKDALLRERPTEAFSKLRQRGVVMAVIGLGASAAGFLMYDKQVFMQSYLIAYMFWIGITVGSMALLMVQYLSGGAWGLVGRRVFEASARNWPLMAILFLPIAFNMPTLYKWVDTTGITNVTLLHQIEEKSSYLNLKFFFIRAGLYFAIWGTLTYFLTRWSSEQDGAPPRLPGPMDGRLRVLSGPGLVLYMLTITFMSVDWMMSLDPGFFSTIFGILTLGGQGLATLAFTILILATLSKSKPVSTIVEPDHFHDFGKLMLAFVMLWAYFNVSQLIIIWSGNLPEEIPWYVDRLHGHWMPVAVAVLIGHFALPFCLLLSRTFKRKASSLSKIAIFVILMRVVDLTWIIGPVNEHFSPTTWLGFATVLGMGGIWLIAFTRNLAGRAVVPAHDPYFEKALAHGGH